MHVTLVDVVELATYTIRTFLVTRVRTSHFSTVFSCYLSSSLSHINDVDVVLQPVEVVRDLGVLLDSQLVDFEAPRQPSRQHLLFSHLHRLRQISDMSRRK